MRILATLLALALLSTTFVSCKAKKALDEAAASANLAKSGTIDLLNSTAEDQYEAPQDGKLTPQQVEIYLKVRDRERVIAQTAKKELQQHGEKAKQAGEGSISSFVEGLKGVGSVGDLLTADIRAAKELGYNTQEYLWIKGQVLQASGAEMAARMQDATAAMLEKSHQEMKKGLDEATDPVTKKLYTEMLANYEKSKSEAVASGGTEEPATAFNRQLLSKYENALNAISSEFAKFEENEGDAQKGIAELQNAAKKIAAGQPGDAGKSNGQ